MSRRSRWLAVAAALIALSIVVGTATALGLLDNVRSSRVLTVGIAVTQPGAYKDIRTDEWTGINVEVARRMAELMGAELEIVETSWDLFLPALNAREFDIFMAGTFYTGERAMQA